MNLRSVSIPLLLALASLASVACAHHQPATEKPAQSASANNPAAPALGETAQKRTESAVVQNRHKEVTITERTTIPTVVITVTRADINRMEPQHFAALGFPSDVARNIVRYRDEHGQFHSVDEIRAVPGVTDQQMAQLKDKMAATPIG